MVIRSIETRPTIGAILPPAKAESVRKAKGGQAQFVTLRVDDPALVAQLEAAGVRYTGQPRGEWLATLLSWMLPVAVFFGMTAWLSRKSGMGAGWAFDVGKSRARVYLESKTGVRFDDVAGIDEARDELREIVDFLQHPQRYRRLGGRARLPLRELAARGVLGRGPGIVVAPVVGRVNAFFTVAEEVRDTHAGQPSAANAAVYSSLARGVPMSAVAKKALTMPSLSITKVARFAQPSASLNTPYALVTAPCGQKSQRTGNV